MSEQQLEELKKDLSQFGTIEQCEQGSSSLSIKVRGFTGNLGNLSHILQTISRHAGAYSNVTVGKCWGGFFQMVLRS